MTGPSIAGKDMPDRIFRYFGPGASDIFVNRQLRVSSILDFHDPFEVSPDYVVALEKELEDGIRRGYCLLDKSWPINFKHYKKLMRERFDASYAEHLEKFVHEVRRRFCHKYGVVCFSGELRSLLMWAHYAIGHRGFAIEFDPTHELFSTRHFVKVVYSKTRVVFGDEDGIDMVRTKAKEWEYEAEYRWVKELEHLERVEQDGKLQYYVDLPLTAVKAVHFGMVSSEATRSQILRALANQDGQHIRLYQMRPHPKDYSLVEKKLPR